jgi:hypothetical protein
VQQLVELWDSAVAIGDAAGFVEHRYPVINGSPE